jgi:predicted RNA-binding protein YlqC (UPF0109 family)
MEPEVQYLLNLIQPIVTCPEDVNVEYKNDDMGVLLTVKVNQADMGRLIGKQGANANAIRTLVRQLGFTNNKRISIKVEEPEGSTRAPRHNDVEDSYNQAKH